MPTETHRKNTVLVLVITEKILSIYWDIYLDSKSIIIQLSLPNNLAISKYKARIKLISNCDHTEAPSLTTQYPVIETGGVQKEELFVYREVPSWKTIPESNTHVTPDTLISLIRTQTYSWFLLIQTVRREAELETITLGKQKN